MDDLTRQFSLIYDQYIEKIYRFVYLKVSSREVAEDITSRVFAKGWDAYRKGNDIKNVGAFLYQIARNSVVDHYRSKEKVAFVGTDRIPEIIDRTNDLHKEAVLASDMEGVRAAIAKLSQEYQDVIILRYIEDMSAEQVAAVLGKPAGTVRVMLHRGLKALRDNLDYQQL